MRGRITLYMAERDAHPCLGHHNILATWKGSELTKGYMTKSQKKLVNFHLTDEEKKAIRREERHEMLVTLLQVLAVVAAGVVALWIISGVLDG